MYRSAEAMHIFLKMYDGFTGLGVSVPINLHLRNLVVMDMQYSNLKRLWDNQEPQFLEHLKHINLSHSVHLTETPNFSYLPNLEKLALVNCKSLVLVHKSIGTLHKKLVHLNLKGCTGTRRPPFGTLYIEGTGNTNSFRLHET